jgi:hypothetical protein
VLPLGLEVRAGLHTGEVAGSGIEFEDRGTPDLKGVADD